MAVPINDFVVLFILTIVHIIAIAFTIKMGQVFDSKSWNFITIGFILLLFRRIMSFLSLFEVYSYDGNLILLIDRIYLPLVFWVLIGLGMIRLYYSIKSSMTVERKLRRATSRKSRR